MKSREAILNLAFKLKNLAESKTNDSKDNSIEQNLAWQKFYSLLKKENISYEELDNYEQSQKPKISFKKSSDLNNCPGERNIIFTTPLDTIISIPDPVLKSYLNKKLGKEITFKKLLEIEKINLKNTNLKSLSGLEYALNLEKLNIKNTQVSDLVPVLNLPDIEILI